MKKFIFPLLLFGMLQGFSQNGGYDVRFVTSQVCIDSSIVYIDLEVRATNPLNSFYLSDQNYRFTHSKEAVETGSIEIVSEGLSGVIPTGQGYAFYDEHNLNGSLDSVISYNVVLLGGDGILVGHDWLKIGTISVNVKANNVIDSDELKCLELIWLKHSDFPPTFIGEKFNNQLFEVDEGSYDNALICNVCPNVPIELAYFEGKAKDCNVLLEWQTETETSNDHFRIERSLDGREYLTIGKVKGAGDSLDPINYSFTDSNVLPLAYYRLVQVDIDGTTEVFDPIVVRSKCYDADITNGISNLFPNPAGDEDVSVQLYLIDDYEEVAISVSDILGREVLTQAVDVAVGPNTVSFPTDRLSDGTYFVQLKTSSWYTIPKKLVITR